MREVDASRRAERARGRCEQRCRVARGVIAIGGVPGQNLLLIQDIETLNATLDDSQSAVIKTLLTETQQTLL